jgi:hypothetical protein
MKNNLSLYLKERAYPFPVSAENAEMVMFLLDQYEKILRSHNSINENSDQKFDQSYIMNLYHLGLFSVVLPEKFGGMAIDPESLSFLLMRIAELDASLALVLLDHTVSLLILLYGDDAEVSEEVLTGITSSPVFISSAPVINSLFVTDDFSVKNEYLKMPEGVLCYVLMIAGENNQGRSLKELMMFNAEQLSFAKYCRTSSDRVLLENILKHNVLYSHKLQENFNLTLKNVDIEKLGRQYIACSVAITAGLSQGVLQRYQQWGEGRKLFGRSIAS